MRFAPFISSSARVGRVAAWTFGAYLALATPALAKGPDCSVPKTAADCSKKKACVWDGTTCVKTPAKASAGKKKKKPKTEQPKLDEAATKIPEPAPVPAPVAKPAPAEDAMPEGGPVGKMPEGGDKSEGKGADEF